MLEFVKKIFKNEEPKLKEIRKINLQEISEWLDNKSKPLIEELNFQIEKILMGINEEIQITRVNIDVLENAKLQNPNIPFRAKQYMEGNRKAYIRSVTSFLGHLEINNKDYFYLRGFCNMFDKLIIDMDKGTLRSYTILQEFFSNETNKIAQNLKNFDDIFSELKSTMDNKKVVSLNHLKEKIKELEIKINQKMNIDLDFKSIEAEFTGSNNEKEEIMKNIEKFNKDDEHINFLNLNEEKNKKTNNNDFRQNDFLQSFSFLERALRKYSHIAFDHEELVLDYLQQPIESLVKDKKLVILDILKNVESLIIENKLGIDEKKKEKPLEEIKKLNKGFFEQFLREYTVFKSELEDIEKQIKISRVPEKLKYFNISLKDINLIIERENKEFDKIKAEVVKLDKVIDELHNEIEIDIKELFNEEIKIDMID